MNLFLAIGLIVVAFVGGSVLGFFLARKSFMDYMKKNPPFNEDMIRQMMSMNGQKPSETKVRQMMQQMKKQYDTKKK
jgi:uncharacterized protein YneF (UPF0154 family)